MNGEETMQLRAMASTLLFCLATPALAAEQQIAQIAIGGAAENQGFIAGSAPAVRPSQAPSLMAVARDAGWHEKALNGVAAPYPQSLRFLDDQGNWYTPFTEPGMPGPYDIRHWHR